MLIGFDGSRAFASRRTGTENYSYQLLKGLAKIDKRNKYIVYLRVGIDSVIARSETTKQSQKGLPGLLESPLDSLRARNDESRWPKNFTFKEINWPRVWTQGGLGIQTFIEDLHILFVPSHTLPIIRKPGLKTVMTVHDLGAEYLPKMHQLKQQLYLKYITKYQLTSATKLIAVSKATMKDLVEKVGVDEKKISVVYEGYDKELFDIVSSKGRSSSGRSLMPFFLFVGTVQPRKNLARLIQAFSLFVDRYSLGSDEKRKTKNEFNLAIVGSKGWMSEEIYELPKKLGIEKRVKFMGFVPDKDMPRFYSNALGLIFPSLFEGFGLPILEAQACGCPVLTSNISSMPEIAGYVRVNRTVAGKGAILVDPYSVESITDGMIKIMDKKIRDNLIKNGYENVKKFSWEKAAKETLKILEGVANG